MLDGLTVSCPVATSAYKRTFSRTSPHPITLRGQPGRFTAPPFCTLLTLHGRGRFSRLRVVKGAASAFFPEDQRIGRSQKGMLRCFLVVVHASVRQLFGGYSTADGIDFLEHFASAQRHHEQPRPLILTALGIAHHPHSTVVDLGFFSRAVRLTARGCGCWCPRSLRTKRWTL